jgi:hypothetical protein
MTPEEIAEMSQGGIPAPVGSRKPVSVPNGYEYFRRCPTCGHLEMVNAPTIQPYSQSVKQPVMNAPDKVSVLNNGKNLEDGGVEAEWR